MKKCLLIVNSLSGNYNADKAEHLRAELSANYDVVAITVPCENENKIKNASEYDLIAVCGGDGTLHRLINENVTCLSEVHYYPSGTLNEAADKRKRKSRTISLVGEADGKLFSYVLAAGTFTPLGYIVESEKKQRFKALAYLLKVIREYKVNRISATVTANKVCESDVYTLIMIINSPRCFGFRFNRMYKEEGPMFLLTIKAPTSTGLIGKIKIFFPFFRAFFIGFNKPYNSHTMTFAPFEELHLSLPENVVFCADGEALELGGDIKVTSRRLPYKIKVSQYEFK